MVICKICNKEFNSLQGLSKHIHYKHKIEAKQYYDTYNKKDNTEGLCLTCNKITPFLGLSKGYQKHCSAKCAQCDPNGHNMFINNNPQKNPAIREKTKSTNLLKYGTSYPLQLKSIKDKIKSTNREKYGVENPFQQKEVQQKARINSHTLNANLKRKKTLRNKINKLAKQLDAIYVQDLLEQTKSSGWYQSGIVNTIKYDGYIFIKNSDIKTVLDYDSNKYLTHSKNEKYIVDCIKDIYHDEIIENSRKIIAPKELDIYFPKLKLAIKYNGSYFHSTLASTPIKYHLDKSLACREKNIRLIHIYEFEDLEKQISLLKDLILGQDNYPKNDFNKNNLIKDIPNPEIIFNDGRLVIYGAGFLK